MKKSLSILAEPRDAFHRPADSRRGLPAITMWPKLPMKVGKNEIVPDYLLRLDNPDGPQLVVLELHHGHVSAASRKRERLLSDVGIAVIRMGWEDPEEVFIRKLSPVIGKTGRITRLLGMHAEDEPPPKPAEAYLN